MKNKKKKSNNNPNNSTTEKILSQKIRMGADNDEAMRKLAGRLPRGRDASQRGVWVENDDIHYDPEGEFAMILDEIRFSKHNNN